MTAKVTGEYLLPFIGFSPEVGTKCSSEVNRLPDYTASRPRINAVVDSYRYRI